MSVVAKRHVDPIDAGRERHPKSGAVTETSGAHDLSFWRGSVRQRTQDQGLRHFDDFIAESAGVTVITKPDDPVYAVCESGLSLFSVVARLFDEGTFAHLLPFTSMLVLKRRIDVYSPVKSLSNISSKPLACE